MCFVSSASSLAPIPVLCTLEHSYEISSGARLLLKQSTYSWVPNKWAGLLKIFENPSQTYWLGKNRCVLVSSASSLAPPAIPFYSDWLGPYWATFGQRSNQNLYHFKQRQRPSVQIILCTYLSDHRTTLCQNTAMCSMLLGEPTTPTNCFE